ncbi:MAG TPA: hypothetical protein PKC43_01540 [Phycisphaerales bacterium]|nr:hypothetical protein [Phycisphaerales bacterium]HMP36108.1 hypothetical protein [Phycisphaerales bacterium]
MTLERIPQSLACEGASARSLSSRVVEPPEGGRSSAAAGRRDDARRCAARVRGAARAAPLAVAAVLIVGGCATKEGPTALEIPRERYPEAFDAALRVLSDEWYVTALRDREGGVIETLPRRAAGLLEPWRTDNDSIAQASHNTLALRQRRIRVEFISTEFAPPTIDAESQLKGPDLLGGAGSADELRTPARGGGAIEIRAWVTLDRADVAGLRRFAWTRRITTRSADIRAGIDPAEGVVAAGPWTPEERDEAMERRLIAAIEAALARGAHAEVAAPEAGGTAVPPAR